ncbi:putative cation-transporting ATPase 1 [Dimargaris verticillata]|uniref:Cation-transporting ATPase 1 n=1 Tax=Dimargaris verticillata TaxID=2761393 RepID=A0A9W8EEJ3_9FUNG|nr:putative cation-transporting ATPase 1 [Dimargaris verticillata]
MTATKGTVHPLVESRSVQHASLHARLPRWRHWYVAPFLSLYPLWLSLYLSAYERYFGSVEYTFVSLLALVILHLLTFLVGQWSIPIKAWTTCRRVRTVAEADVIQIIPKKDRGKNAMCSIEQSQSSTSGATKTGDTEQQVHFYFQKKRYTYDPTKDQFVKLHYPSHSHPPLGKFQTSRGLSTSAVVETATSVYGPNRFEIPIPTFQELFKEHAVAPFFVFQIFCVGLWCLDEYWYYSLFTLAMLVIFESTVVFQRQRTLKEFRSMSMEPYKLYVFRENEWQAVMSDELLPGDLCSLTRSQDESAVPCDMILVDGSCIVNEAMLSGESTPLLKESISLRDPQDQLDMNGVDKMHMMFGGTKVLQVTPPSSSAASAHQIPVAPDQGCLVYVLRTGFGSAQGKLVRTMIFNTERVSANNLEALLFILFLLIFAVAAAAYVWVEGMQNEKRKKFKVILDCIMIITSVVPPELPMELSLAVNTSLVALSRYAIYCTEPFRIPFAGKLDICCFDKTGTLTGEDLVVEGVAGLGADMTVLRDPKHLPYETTMTLATAHALVLMDDDDGKETMVGDPMEKAALQAIGWTMRTSDLVVPDQDLAPAGSLSDALTQLTILRRYQFSSALKRMSTVVRSVSPRGGSMAFAAVKGAPETIQTMLTAVPAGYEEAYKRFSRQGSRVLALGYKQMPKVRPNATEAELNRLARDSVECDLQFVGFLVFHCPLKPDTKQAIDMLNRSSHRVVMITGDNALTACHIAHQLDIVERPVLVLDAVANADTATDETAQLQWMSIDESIRRPMDPTVDTLDADIHANYDLCLTGGALAVLQGRPIVQDLISHVWVYARFSPSQKEYILTTMKQSGYITLMCGDGTNDVGALKQAHVGVALLDGQPDDLRKIAERQRIERMKSAYETQASFAKRFNMPPPPPPPALKAILDAQDRKRSRDDRKRLKDQKERKKKTASKPLSDKGPPHGSTDAHQSSMAEPSDPVVASGEDGVASPGNDKDHDKKKKTKRKKPKKPKDSQVASSAASMSAADRAAQNQFHSTTDRLQTLMQDMEMDDDVPTIKFGDASVASPFTSKLSTVMSVCTIVRQGRCTLVATLQMYKILALQSLISAYSLSVLYLEGIKHGDTQVTILGMLVAVCFMCISRASPREELSVKRPRANIFNFYIILSVLGQFAVHTAALVYVMQNAKFFMAAEGDGEDAFKEIDLDGEFTPTLLNTAVYLVSLSMQVSTFAINYQGYPFRESLRDNKIMYRGLLLVGGIAVMGATEFIPELNEMIQFVPLPAEFKPRLLAAMTLDFGLAWLIEVVCSSLFSDNRPKAIVLRRKVPNRS